MSQTTLASRSVSNLPEGSPTVTPPRTLSPSWVKAWMFARLISGPVAAAMVIAILLSGLVPVYTTFTIALAAVYGLLVLSVSLLASWSGIWSIGHPALLAIGAYSASYGSAHGWSLEVTAIFAMVVCAAFGAFLGFAGSRFSVLYVALLTLAFTLVIIEIISVWKGVTNGDQGVPVTEFSSIFGTFLAADNTALCVVVGVFGVALAIAEFMRRTPLRMRLVAAKTHPLAARTVGIAPEAQSAISFAASGATAGLAGVMLALVSGFVSPESFSLVLAVNIIAATVFGGTGSLIGAVVGGAFLAGAPSLAGSLSIDQPYLIGGLLILALIFLPEGIVPTVSGYLNRWTHWNDRLRSAAIAGSVNDETPDFAGAPTNKSRESLLEVAGLGVRYGGLQAVQDVDLSLVRGEVLAVIGPNGAGKTTFVNALSGLTGGGKLNGTMLLEGRDLRKVRPVRRRSLGLGRTFQHAELFGELTILDNVLVVRRRITRADRAQAFALLQSVGLHEYAFRKPGELPFGLQKRADLARAIAESPKVLILDEPFGGLDSGERAVLASHILRVREEGTCVIIIDHVLDDLFAVADRVVAFDFGQLVATGSPDTVLQDEAVRRSYLGVIDGESLQSAPTRGGASVISLTDTSHHYGGVRALEAINLEVAAGSIFGVVGANGAGKSSLGRILHGSLKASDGSRIEALRDGRPLRISLVPEGRALFKTLSVRENLEVAAYAGKMRGSQLRNRLDEMSAWLPERVRTRMDISAGSLSGGEQQLVAIARALMVEPDVLILDEPALGLSPAMVQEVYRQIGQLATQGITTILLDQSLPRALQSCSDVIVLRQGEIVSRGNSRVEGFAQTAENAYFGDAHSLNGEHA